MNLGIEYVVSDKDLNFTEALAGNRMEIESLAFPYSWSKVELHECIIENVTIQSKQNLEWDVWIFSTSGGNSSDLDSDTFLDGFNFPKTEGWQIEDKGQYYYVSPTNHIAVPFKDEDMTAKIHVGLINRSTQAKYTGASGEVKVRLMVRGVYGV